MQKGIEGERGAQREIPGMGTPGNSIVMCIQMLQDRGDLLGSHASCHLTHVETDGHGGVRGLKGMAEHVGQGACIMGMHQGNKILW